MHEITTVIFDVGRVLVKIDGSGEKFGALMQKVGVSPEEAFERFWYVDEIHQFMTGQIDAEDFYILITERFHIDYTFAEFAEAWCDLFQPMPGMEDIFRRMAGQFQVGLLSDTDPLHWRKIRELLPWLDRVKKPTLSHEVGYLKPHPVMFSTAAANCGASVGQCLFIDDVVGNVDGARYSGMPAVLFSDPAKLKKNLIELGIWR